MISVNYLSVELHSHTQAYISINTIVIILTALSFWAATLQQITAMLR